MDRLERRLDDSTVLLGGRIDALDGKVDRLRAELVAEFGGRMHTFDTRLVALDQKISRNFIWTTGIQVAVLLAVVTALAGR